jgi:AGZA family xanthine/uracil permease-like MFS transporter
MTTATPPPRYAWARWGDVNAFFGLMLDNVAVMGILVVSLCLPADTAHFRPGFVLTHMIPGTALGVLLGDLVYTYLAFRVARRTGRTDVTAMPLGLDTPSTFAVALLVLLPALHEGQDLYGVEGDRAALFAWHVGALVLVLVGVFKSLLAPLGNFVRRAVPRAGLLGSLAAIALALIAFVPLWFDVAAVPLVGMLSLTVILITLVARRTVPGRIPGALAAVVVGLIVYWVGVKLGEFSGVPLVPPHGALPGAPWQPLAGLRDLPHDADWWLRVGWAALGKLPLVLPFALATIVGGIDCTESAVAAGDEYDTRAILLTEGLASVAAGLAGGVIQNTPYIGHPAYKAMGGRAAYTLATALFVGTAGYFGWFTHVFEWLPQAAMFPILIYVGLEITAQSFHATPVRHYPALALSALPALAYLATLPLNAVLRGGPPPADEAVHVQTLRCLANGFIVTSLLWGAALAALLDDRPVRSAAYLVLAAAFTLVGIIHSPLPGAPLKWPQEVWRTLAAQGNPALLCQSPYHWAGAYLLAAGLIVGLGRIPARREKV